MKALYARKSFDFKIEDTEPKKPGIDEVLVKVHACGLCGTDMHFARDWTEDWAALGHEIAGEVIETGDGNIPYKPGDKVIVEDVALCGICANCKSGKTWMCSNMYDLGGQPGMAGTMTVNYRLLDPFDGIDWVHATLVEPLAVAFNTVINGRIPLGGNVVVTGPGPIGLMCVRLAKLKGAAKVALVGNSADRKRGKARLEAGEKLGADYIIEAAKGNPAEEVKRVFPDGADTVLVTAPPKSLPQAVGFSRFGGTVSFIGIDLGGKNRVEIDVNELIFNKVSLIPTFAEPAQSFPKTIHLLQEKLVDPNLIVSHTFGFEDAEEMFRKNESADHPVLKPVFVTQ